MSAVDIRNHLVLLQHERIEAERGGLTDCDRYLSDLEEEIEACRYAFVGMAVTEIAVLRAEMSGPLVG